MRVPRSTYLLLAGGFVFLFSGQVFAQHTDTLLVPLSTQNDTILLNISTLSNSAGEEIPGLSPMNSLQVLSDLGTVYFKHISPTGLASFSYQGNAPAQNIVRWNGLTLNSPFYGQADMNLLPLYFTATTSLKKDEVSPGGAIVELHSDGESYSHQFQAGISSLQNYEFNYRYSGPLSLGIYGRVAANHFRYPQWDLPDHPLRVQTNNDRRDLAFFADRMSHLLRGHSLHLSVLYNHSYQEIPPLSISQYSQDVQRDHRLCTGLFWEKKYVKASFENSLQYTRQNIDFNQDLSQGHFIRVASSFRYSSAKWGPFSAALSLPLSTATTPYFAGWKNLFLPELSGGIKLRTCQLSPSWPSLGLRCAWGPSHKIAWGMSLAAPLFEKDRCRLELHTEKYFRLPTLNDLYWQPGGNASLKPEKGYRIELKTKSWLLYRPEMKIAVNGDFYAYYQTEQILWLPDELTNLYHATNAGHGRRVGTDLTAAISFSMGPHTKMIMRQKVSFLYAQNRPQPAQPFAKALYYPPLSSLSGLQLENGKFTATTTFTFEQPRAYGQYKTSGVYLWNMGITRRIYFHPEHRMSTHIEISFLAYNLLHLSYEYIPYRPQALLHVGLNLKLLI